MNQDPSYKLSIVLWTLLNLSAQLLHRKQDRREENNVKQMRTAIVAAAMESDNDSGKEDVGERDEDEYELDMWEGQFSLVDPSSGKA